MPPRNAGKGSARNGKTSKPTTKPGAKRKAPAKRIRKAPRSTPAAPPGTGASCVTREGLPRPPRPIPEPTFGLAEPITEAEPGLALPDEPPLAPCGGLTGEEWEAISAPLDPAAADAAWWRGFIIRSGLLIALASLGAALAYTIGPWLIQALRG